jgi:hypothetical protein
MGKLAIIEQSEAPDGLKPMALVRNERGDEALVDVDAAVLTVAEIVLEAQHERRMGWHLENGFYREAFAKIARCLSTKDPRHG